LSFTPGCKNPMFSRLKRLLAPPVFADEETTRVAALLNIITLSSAVVVVIRSLVTVIFQPNPLPFLCFAGLGLILTVGTLVLMRHGHVRLACYIVCMIGVGLATAGMFYFGGVRRPIYNLYLLTITTAGLLL